MDDVLGSTPLEALQRVLTVAVIGFIGFRLVTAARITFGSRGAGRRAIAVARGIRWRHVWPVPFVLAAVVVTSNLLLRVPYLDFGWWTAIGGEGNPAIGSTTQTRGTILEFLIPITFMLLLLPSLPLFVENEERIFRLGAETWSWPKRLWKALVFGLVHALVGIPIGVALALTVGGVWFTLQYLRGARRGGAAEGLLESTRHHLAYNGTIVTLLLLAFTYDAVVVYGLS